MHHARNFSILASLLTLAATAEVNRPDKLAPDVYFHEGDIAAHGHCNNGWIVFDDYILVIDGNFPSGAQEVLPKIKGISSKPIRFAFDTHHHGDHAYGNLTWAENGASIVAQRGVLDEMKKYETGFFGGKPGRWEDTAKTRPDVAASKLKTPSVYFQKEMLFDDGKHEVELLYFGVAHTHGDGFAWLPKEKILFTGDACVNGAFNYAADGDTAQWIQTLEEAKKLGAKIICPGHGPVGTADLLGEQQEFFVELRKEVAAFVKSGKTAAQIGTALESMKTSLSANPRIAKFVGRNLAGLVQKVVDEMK